MALSREHWHWLRSLVEDLRTNAGEENRGAASELSYHDGKRDGYREAANELEQLLDDIATWYE